VPDLGFVDIFWGAVSLLPQKVFLSRLSRDQVNCFNSGVSHCVRNDGGGGTMTALMDDGGVEPDRDVGQPAFAESFGGQ
jgi:hypothetical protein